MRVRRALISAAVVALLAALLGLPGCGGGDDEKSPGAGPTAPQSATETNPDAPDDAIQDRPGGPGRPPGDNGQAEPGHPQDEEPPGAFPAPKPQPPGTRPAPASAREGIRRSIETYIGGLNARDGRAVCNVFAPGALDGFDLPRRTGGCAASVSASIGFAAPGGQPRWLGTRLVDSDSVVLVRGGDGRLTGTVIHRFRGTREPSIEEDVIYLRDTGGRWLIAKPSSIFYRAVGIGDVPLSALTPPKP